jgi:hypothetical protein
VINKSGKEIVNYWGVKTSAAGFFKSLLLALAVFAGLYAIVFFADLCFNADFRIWMISIMPFTLNKMMYALAYAPIFLYFYLINSILINGGNNRENFPEWLVTLMSCFANIISIVVLFMLQYIPLFAGGFTPFDTMRVNLMWPILALVPTATVISRFFFKKTGNIYAGSAVVAFVFTMLTCTGTLFSASIFM